MTTLAIRTDALPETGMGHLIRCLALAHAARADGWCVHGLGRVAAPLARERALDGVDAWHDLPARHPDPADLKATQEALDAIAPDWIVLDGYAFDPDYQRALRRRARLLALDDQPRLPTYAVDLLLDQNLGAQTRHYPVEPGGRALLGSRYTLLRPEFLAPAAPVVAPSGPLRLLVTLGGMVAPDALAAVAEGLNRLATPLAVTLLTGADPATPELARRLAGGPHHWRFLPWHDDMPGLMRTCDLAVSAAGSTSWELAHLGIPGLYLTLADNQAGIAAALAGAGAGIDLGEVKAGVPGRLAEELRRLLKHPDRRADMAARARALVDGQGARRVLEAMA